MTSLIEQINQGRIWPMSGGVHPPQRKRMSNTTSAERLPLAKTLYIPIRQHMGEAGRILVKPGDIVFKGQPLTTATSDSTLPTHASTSGKVIDIVEHVSAHASGLPTTTVILEPDNKDVWLRMPTITDAQIVDKATVIERIKQAGIAGMGGAGFPSHIKANTNKPIDCLIVNAVECEPYITTDDRLMRDYATQIVQGIDILCYLLAPKIVIIAIEDNKPEAIKIVSQACQGKENIQITKIPTVYPAGGEKQLIEILTGKQVPSGKLPLDIGLVMQNIATCYAIAQAVHQGEALVERLVTVTGLGFDKPGNYWLPIGTPISHVLEHCEYQLQQPNRIIMGGPMMGFSVSSDLVPVVKITNCLLGPTRKEMPLPGNEMACIRCSQCADACPANLLPQQLYWYSKSKDYDKAQEYNLADCIECGACAYVCPSQIPLVQYYRTAKADIRQQRHDKEKSEQAKDRFEARNARLERDKQQREERHRKAAEARKATQGKGNSDQNALIAAALARAKAKKQQAGKNNTTAQASQAEPATPSSEDPKKAAVAAAIARAKAKKQQAEQASSVTEKQPDTAQLTSSESDAEVTKQPSPQPTTAESKKKAAIAAAIAKAKAKQLAAKQHSDNDKEEP